MQSVERTMVKQVISLQPMEDPHVTAGKYAVKEAEAAEQKSICV